jgi:hypothetical protein
MNITPEHKTMLDEMAKLRGDEFRWARACWRKLTGAELRTPKLIDYKITTLRAYELETMVRQGLGDQSPAIFHTFRRTMP